jgi:excisionase family DNA binding protein
VENELITVREAAALAHVHDRTIRRWFREQRLTKHVTGTGRVRVDRGEVVALATATPAVTGAGA